MSFPKAKIHRFNEDIHCAPPPGTYNPEIIDKTVGPIINKSERFAVNKSVFHASSSESLNSLNEKNVFRKTTDFFKTPKIPSNSYKFKYNSEIKRKMSFSQKSSSVECINKKKDISDFEIICLSNNFKVVQEKLHLEENKTTELLQELKQLRESCLQTDEQVDLLIEVIRGKNDIISILKEKCHILENIESENLESNLKHVSNVFSIFEMYSKMCSESEVEYCQIMERYESLISEYESDFQEFLSWLIDLLQKNNRVTFEQLMAAETSDGRKSQLAEMLKESERERKRYELIVQETQKVINVLSQRVLESDREVEKIMKTVNAMKEEIEKLSDTIENKNEEILALHAIINTVVESFLNELQITKTDLLNSVDSFKKEAKNNYENSIVKKDDIISELLKDQNQKELRLQEALDQIETLKCKEETLLKIVEQCRSEKCQKLIDQQIFCEIVDKSSKPCLVNDNATCNKNEEDKVDINLKLQSHDVLNFFKNLIEKAFNCHSDKSVQQYDKTNSLSLNDVLPIENVEKPMKLTVDIFKKDFEVIYSKNKFIWLRDLLLHIYNTFHKFETENFALRNDFSRLRNNFIEKCDECSELTHLLRISENHVEHSEKKVCELESCQREWELKHFQLQTEIEELKHRKSCLNDEIANEKSRIENNDNVIESLNKELDYARKTISEKDNCQFENQLKQLEDLLSEQSSKFATLETENSKLCKLIGPFRQQLENFKIENKVEMPTSDSDAVQRYSRLLEHQNHKQKVKQIIKLRNEVIQLKKKNDELQVEVGKYRKTVLKTGKENKCLKKGSQELKSSGSEVSVNSTYIITSPKVNRI